MTGGLEASVAADEPSGIAHVDDGHHSLLLAVIGATVGVTILAGGAGGVSIDRPVLRHHERIGGGRDGHVTEVLGVVILAIRNADVDAAPLEDLELAYLLESLRVGHVEGVDPRLLGLAGRHLVAPAPVVVLRDVGNQIDGVVDLAGHALAQFADDVGRAKHARVRQIGDVDGHQLRDIVTVELKLAIDLTEIEGVAQKRIYGVARDEHLDGIAIDRQARELLGVLGIDQIVDDEAAVGVEVEKPVGIDAVDVRFLDRGIPAARSPWSRGVCRGAGTVDGGRRSRRAFCSVGRRLCWATVPLVVSREVGLARGDGLARVRNVDRTGTARTAAGRCRGQESKRYEP